MKVETDRPAVDENPYRSPDSVADAEQAAQDDAPKQVVLRGRVNTSRFLAANIDHAFAVVLFLAVGMNSAELLGNIGAGIVALSTYVCYYFLSEWLIGSTPGKLLFGLVVRQINGPCQAHQIGIRTLLRFVEVNPLLLGAIPAGIAVWCTQRGQRIGDILAGTVVVQAYDLPGAKASGRMIRIVKSAR
jgi:uncharacterized RDD family membrane protein YckC